MIADSRPTYNHISLLPERIRYIFLEPAMDFATVVETNWSKSEYRERLSAIPERGFWKYISFKDIQTTLPDKKK